MVAACVGTKEFVATLPQLLKLRTPDRDTVLWVHQRIAALQDERQSRWQKLLAGLLGQPQ